jgi:outer membrane protein TolC
MKYTLVIVGCLLSSTANADYLYDLTKNHPAIIRQQTVIDLSESKIPKEALSALPEANLSIKQGKSTSQVNDGDVALDRPASLELEGTWTILEYYNPLDKVKKQQLDVTTEKLNLYALRLTLWKGVANQYLDYTYAKKEIGVVEGYLNKMRKLRKTAKSSVDENKLPATTISSYDLIIAQVESIREDLQRKADLAESTIMSQFPYAKISTKEFKAPKGNISDLLTIAINENPAAVKANLGLKVTELEVKQGYSPYLPKLEIYGKYTDDLSGFKDGKFGFDSKGSEIGVRLKIPLGFGAFGERNIAEQKRSNNVIEKDVVRMELKSQLEQEYQAAKITKEYVDSFGSQISAIRKREADVQLAVDKGSAQPLELLGLYQSAVSAQLSQLESRKEIESKYISMWALIGKAPSK